MKPWPSWNRFDWSEALLKSYFGLPPDGNSEPVRILVVTDDRLCQVVGEAVAAPEHVRMTLIDKTLMSVGQTNYWIHASDQWGTKPDYLAHLMVACIAATDCSDLDERSYLKRLEEIAGPSAVQHIELMPELWQKLQQWLHERPGEYRPLVLPDPHGWVRIGHTTRLAFPSRSDQMKLREVLAEQKLILDEVPLGAVVKGLAAKRQTFTKHFREELDSFEQALRSGSPASALYDTALWSAITSASKLDVEAQQDDPTQRWTIVGVDDGYELHLRVVTNGKDTPAPFRVVECQEPFGLWTHELFTAEGSPATGDALTDHSLCLGNLSGLARGGVIPLIEAAHGAMEVASKQDFEFVTVAVVSDACREEVQKRFGGGRASDCGVSGWGVVRNIQLRTRRPEDFKGSVLEHCWVLHETPFPVSLRLIGGVRIGDGYLGKRSILPRVRVIGADRTTATTDNLEIELDAQDGYWTFPTKGLQVDLDGRTVVRAKFASDIRERHVRFVSSPTSESFKVPGDLSAWQVEGTARSQSLNSVSENYAESLQPARTGVDYVTRLARDVGVFASTSQTTTWEIATFGTTNICRLTAAPSDAIPTHRSPSDGDRRKWRKALSRAGFAEGDAARGVARGVVARGDSDKVLPEVAGPGERAPTASLAPCRKAEHPRIEDLVDVLCAMSNRSAGVEPAVWRRLCREFLELDWPQFKAVSRAWSEANLFDETVSRRWSTRRVLAVQPHLIVFQTDRWFGASLQGLSLDVTRRHLREAAEAASMLVETTRSRSGLVPETVAIRADSIEKIESVARRLALPTKWLRPDCFRIVVGRDLTLAPPGGYERSTSVNDLDGFDGVDVERWWKGGSPGMWTVKSKVHRTWTHYESAADFWASAFAGRPIVQRLGGGRLRRDGAYLPLIVARWLSAVAPVLSGPDPDEGNAYVYECPSEMFGAELLGGLAEFVEEQMILLTTSHGLE